MFAVGDCIITNHASQNIVIRPTDARTRQAARTSADDNSTATAARHGGASQTSGGGSYASCTKGAISDCSA